MRGVSLCSKDDNFGRRARKMVEKCSVSDAQSQNSNMTARIESFAIYRS
jgi:hypothetical protein